MSGQSKPLLCILCLIFLPANAGAQNWAVWKHNATRPGAVAVAPLGQLSQPWTVDSVWHTDAKSAWKKACWLVRNGDLYGRRYHSASISGGLVVCDQNCNCRL